MFSLALDSVQLTNRCFAPEGEVCFSYCLVNPFWKLLKNTIYYYLNQVYLYNSTLKHFFYFPVQPLKTIWIWCCKRQRIPKLVWLNFVFMREREMPRKVKWFGNPLKPMGLCFFSCFLICRNLMLKIPSFFNFSKNYMLI